MRRGPFRLPVRLWLALMVTAISVIALSVEFGITLRLENGWQQQAEDARVVSVQRILGSSPARWRRSAWQRKADTSFAALGVEVAVFRSGQMVPAFATAGARRFLATAGTAQAGQEARPPYYPPSPRLPVFQRLDIPAPGAGRPSVGVAFLWYTRLPPGSPSTIWWFVVGFGTIWLLVGVVLWSLHRPVLQPLTAMSRAAQSVAGGDLDVRLPSSPVREIAEVAEALEGMSGALRDSHMKQRALEEDRRLFISAVAHDLRTPLFMLRGYLKGLQIGVAATPEKVSHYVDICMAKADALERLIADLFAFTRLEYLEQEPERTPVELGDLLREAVDGVQPLAADRGITFHLDGSDESCPLLGDRHLLGRAVENLLDNALRHTREGGEIRVGWGRQGENLAFSVEDTGPGIAGQDLPHIFTPLYRAEASRNRQTGGAGLGLSIARRIVRAHGGDLTAENAPTGGARFTATLPAAQHARASREVAVSGGS